MLTSRLNATSTPSRVVHPLEWAVTTLAVKHDKPSGITDDPNGWHVWADEPFNLIRHLRRLAHVGAQSAAIIAALPQSLEPDGDAANREEIKL